MTTPPDQDRPPYAPPYGSAPAYSDGGHGAGYDTSAYPPPPPTVGTPAAPASPRRSMRRPVALLLACLLSGGVGGGVAHVLDDDGGSPASSSATAVSRGTTSTAPAQPGTTEAAAAVISPSVVTIAVTGREQVTGQFGQTGSQTVSGTGSGIVLRPEGYIVTNNHVVSAAVDSGSVSVTFSDGSTVPATIVGTDPTSDLAVIKVDKTGLTAATFADSDDLSVGQSVLAVGAPLGLSNTVTEGIVSTLGRPVRTGEQGASEQSVIDAVQTDAAINPGNSGGALVDLAGHVVGINSAIATAGGGASGQSGNIGVGFAIPSNDAVEVADELIADGTATHPQIGINVGDAAGQEDGTPGRGASVEAVSSGGPAAEAGLQAGDIITEVGDRAVTDADSLIVAIRANDPGDQVQITYLRGGSTQTTTATLAEAPTR